MLSSAETYLMKIWEVLRGKDAAVPAVPISVSDVSMTKHVTYTVIIANGQAESDVIDISHFVGDAGVITIPSAWTAASIGFKVSATSTGTYSALRDEFGNIVQVTGIQTAAAGVYKLPDALRGVLYLKLWSHNAGVSANQGADRVITLSVKG